MIKRMHAFLESYGLREIFFQLQDSCLAACKFLLVKTQFCRTVLYVIIVILEIFARHLSDRIKYFVSQNEILLVLTDRPALFVKTGHRGSDLDMKDILSRIHVCGNTNKSAKITWGRNSLDQKSA